MDPSEEKLGTAGIDRSRHGGIDNAEDSRILLGDCRVFVEEESCVGVGGLKSCSIVGGFLSCRIAGGSHMDICSRTIRDVRRMQSSLHFQSCPLLSSQVVETTAQIYHSVKACFCRKYHFYADNHNNHVDVDNHKKVRFQINGDNNNDIHNTTTNPRVNTNTVGTRTVVVQARACQLFCSDIRRLI